MSKRIYLIENGETQHLVKANTKASAQKFVAAKTMTATVATPDQLVELTKKGVAVEEAGEKSE